MERGTCSRALGLQLRIYLSGNIQQARDIHIIQAPGQLRKLTVMLPQWHKHPQHAVPPRFLSRALSLLGD